MDLQDAVSAQRFTLSYKDNFIPYVPGTVLALEGSFPEETVEALETKGHTIHSKVYPGMTGDDTGEQLAAMLRETRPRVVAQGVLRWPGVPSVPDYTPQFQPALRELYALDPLAIPNPPHPRMLRLWRLRD